MSIIKRIESFEKAKSVISSCNTLEHIGSAEKYIQLYNKKFEDMLGAQQLNFELQEQLNNIYEKRRMHT